MPNLALVTKYEQPGSFEIGDHADSQSALIYELRRRVQNIDKLL